MTDLTHLLHLDLETTGLWTAPNEPPMVLEMAALLMPFGSLDPADALSSLDMVFPCPESTLQAMVPFVADMHTHNGLLSEVRDSTNCFGDAQQEVFAAFDLHDIDPAKVAMAGSGIAPFDVPLLRHWMFDLYSALHYAPYDLGTGRRTLTMLFGYDPDTNYGLPESNHRAMPDVLLQLAEARAIRDKWKLVPR